MEFELNVHVMKGGDILFTIEHAYIGLIRLVALWVFIKVNYSNFRHINTLPLNKHNTASL